MTFKGTTRNGAAALAAAAGILGAGAADAATRIDFSLLNGAAEIAGGSFTYDDSVSGILDYADLTSFSYAIGTGAAYDLAFVTSGGFFSQYYYFGFDTVSQAFVPGALAGGFYQAILTAIKSSGDSGFYAGSSSYITNEYKDYATNQRGTFTTIEISASQVAGGVPEPAAWALMIVGFAGAGAALRRRRISAPA
ncbi:MAG: PEP-CTERM sorting domain-containing protein [Phenylobacterium sp.]|uniref:PEPxxWA-CTERM sorting domain-containing protein n=1 Tax=Phenylobacterium sp. TaxID=1871053 RepID=UPI001A47424A|nr:PEPxxWA-CTERM sorting domain-containing protein [Phenylobacterium sp.]MBL8555804.1 PEP-CTERM sorting domain-containing protein [Phenylobacterium sp.]